MAVYKTARRQMLIDFMSSHSGQSFTVRDIAVELAAGNTDFTLSESTIYRLMRELVTNGIVVKDVNPESRENVYYYPSEGSTGVSMRCRVCGSVYSVDDVGSRRIKDEISRCGAAVPGNDIEFLIKCKKCK